MLKGLRNKSDKIKGTIKKKTLMQQRLHQPKQNINPNLKVSSKQMTDENQQTLPQHHLPVNTEYQTQNIFSQK